MHTSSLLLGITSCVIDSQSFHIVSEGLTPFERGIDRSYSGKPAMYGEEILGYLKTGLKAGPRWQHGFFWGGWARQCQVTNTL